MFIAIPERSAVWPLSSNRQHTVYLSASGPAYHVTSLATAALKYYYGHKAQKNLKKSAKTSNRLQTKVIGTISPMSLMTLQGVACGHLNSSRQPIHANLITCAKSRQHDSTTARHAIGKKAYGGVRGTFVTGQW